MGCLVNTHTNPYLPTVSFLGNADLIPVLAVRKIPADLYLIYTSSMLLTKYVESIHNDKIHYDYCVMITL